MSKQGTPSAVQSDEGPATTNFLSSVTMDQLNDNQRGLINSVSLLESNKEITGQTLLLEFADMFPPAALFGKELSNMPAIYSELRNFLDSRGENMQQHSSRRIMITLAHKLYAKSIVYEIIASGRRTRTDFSRLTEQKSPPAVELSKEVKLKSFCRES